MKDRHILEILDGQGYGELAAGELATVQAHAAVCPDCRRAFDAARISGALLAARAASSAPEPSAFFQSKVLQAIREKQNLRKPIAAFRRWWQASYPLVCSMLFIVVTLALLTALAPKPQNTQAAASTYNLYSTDSIILDQTQPRSITTEQALDVIYTERREAVKNDEYRKQK
ncbi:MAG TPA: zf-HC2 domain-containing protein [Pyrinomonadaceae bacterium]|jgi:predicted anti-sigma-YlaC factor YlaD